MSSLVGLEPTASPRAQESVAIACENLRRVYPSASGRESLKETVALEGLSLSIPGGTVYGLLGPNGAGKTTTVRILSTLLLPTSGTARVLGHDVVSETAAVRRIIGLAIGGDRGFYGRITGRQNLLYFGALSGLSRREAKDRAVEVLDVVQLGDRADEKVERYSRGMRQRLHLARALLTRPRVLFLDEPTLGIDPVMAREFRRIVPELAAAGTTILLTTHYMQEADELCDRLAIIDRGRLVAEGSPADIKGQFGEASALEAVVRGDATDLLPRVRGLPGVESASITQDGMTARLTVTGSIDSDTRRAVVDAAGEGNLQELVQRRRTLEEAYLAILARS